MGIDWLEKQLNDGAKEGEPCTQIENGLFFIHHTMMYETQKERLSKI